MVWGSFQGNSQGVWLMKRYWVVLSLSLLFAVPQAQSEVPLSAEGIQNRMMVLFRPGVTEDQQRKLVESQGLEILRVHRPIRAMLVRVKPGKFSTAEVRLLSNPSVFHVARDFYANWLNAEPVSFQARPLPSAAAMMKNLPKLRPNVGKSAEVQWGVRRVNAPAAWPSNKGRGVKIGIVDTGIDPKHPDLAARVKGGHNAIDKDQPWHDDHSHGSHVAGITAATLNGSGVVGVAPEADLYGIKVLTKEGSGSLFGIVGGIMWCVENGMHVVNMSLGAAQGNFLFEYAVNALANADIPLIAASGNDGKTVNYPAKYPAAIAVSALCPPEGDENPKLCSGKAIATFSSRGPEVEFIAPGVKIPSSVLGGGIKAYSGTSMAAPHVTGLAALALANGAKGVAGVRAALKGAAEKLPGLSPSEQGAGVINAGKL